MRFSKNTRWLIFPAVLFIVIPRCFSATWYVSPLASGESGTNWASAFHLIQEAIDAADPEDTVLVGDGIYDSGGVAIHSMSNRVAATKPITVKSINGPMQTLIVGTGTLGTSAMRCAYVSNGATFHGFTFTNGHSHASGDDVDALSGGGAWIDGGTVSNCLFIGNSAVYGGGANCHSNGMIVDCTLTGNSADHDGGGVYIDYGGTLMDCTLSDNVADVDGGGVFFDYGGILRDCELSGNNAGNYGGGGFCHAAGTFSNSLFSGNAAPYGGGMNCYTGGVFYSCTFSGNTADFDGGAVYIDYGGMFSGCFVSDNVTGRNGGGVHVDFGGVFIDTVLSGNSAANYGGGAYCYSNGTFNSCVVISNSALYGGGVNCLGGGTLNNCILRDNSAVFEGGGVYHDYAGTLNHCTITDNSASTTGGGVYCDFGGILNNSIVWGNTPGNWHVSEGYWTNCCTLPAFGVDCIATNPQFAAAGNYRLLPVSSCIDAGILIPAVITDREGTSRPLDGNADSVALPDIGAYEFASSAADTDGDQVSDLAEYVADTDGTDPDDWFYVEVMSNRVIHFNSSAARQYSLMYCTNLVEGLWITDESQRDVMGSGGSGFFSGTNDLSACFFRVLVEIP